MCEDQDVTTNGIKNVALVGCGMIAKYVLSGIEASDVFRCVAICDQIPQKMNNPIFDRYKKYTEYHEMLSIEEVHAVILLVHHKDREGVLLNTLKNGYDVICEKPLFSTYQKNKIIILDKFFSEVGVPFIMYHRSYSAALPMVINKLKLGTVNTLRIIYHEEITKHTTNEAIVSIGDVDGGGCIFDNFPNCIHGLLDCFALEYRSANIYTKNRKGYTYKANIDLYIAEINCRVIVDLDWHSSVDRKVFELTEGTGTHTIDMQQGFFPPKDSLYSEYQRMFKNYTHWMNKEAYAKSLRVAELICDIYEKGKYINE